MRWSRGEDPAENRLGFTPLSNLNAERAADLPLLMPRSSQLVGAGISNSNKRS
jgi:hypothetical protein